MLLLPSSLFQVKRSTNTLGTNGTLGTKQRNNVVLFRVFRVMLWMTQALGTNSGFKDMTNNSNDISPTSPQKSLFI